MPTDKTPDSPKLGAAKPDPFKADASKSAPGLKDFKPDPKAARPAQKQADKKGAKSATASKTKPVKTRKPKTPKSGVSFPVAALMAIIASGAGAAGGWILPKVFDPANAAPAQAITQNAQAIKSVTGTVEGLSETSQTLTAGLNAVTAQVRSRSGQAGEITALNQAVADIQSVDIAANRAAALEPLTLKLDAFETLITPEGEDTGVASQLLERLTALETRLAELQTAPPVSMEPTVLSYSTPSNDALAPEAIKTEAPEAPYDLIANFPREAMLSALSVQSQNTQEPSWLRKIISKHVQTDNLSVGAAKSVITDAEARVKAGDIAGAITLIESLNPTLRAAAHSWMIEAKSAIK